MLLYTPRHWLRLLLRFRGSFVRGVPLRLFAFGTIAVVATELDRRGVTLHLPAGVHEAGGAVIALIFAFRVNTGYNRFWEGRGLWGAIVNASRNLDRLVLHHASQTPEEQRRFSVWVVSFAHATRRRLRGEATCPEIERLLGAEQYAVLTGPASPPLVAASELSRWLQQLLSRGAIDAKFAVQAEAEVNVLVNSLGGCERILKTPTPLGLVLLVERLIALYLSTLPFMLLGRVELFTPLVTLLIAYPILMIDALGAEFDDPFGHDANDLPLTRICTTIERDLLGSEPPPEMVFAGNAHGAED